MWSMPQDGTAAGSSINDSAIDPSGNLYVLATVTNATRDARVTCYTPEGTVLWSRTIDRGGEEEGLQLIVDINRNVSVTCYSDQPGAQADYVLAYLTPSGTGQWLYQVASEPRLSAGPTIGTVNTQGDFEYTIYNIDGSLYKRGSYPTPGLETLEDIFVTSQWVCLAGSLTDASGEHPYMVKIPMGAGPVQQNLPLNRIGRFEDIKSDHPSYLCLAGTVENETQDVIISYSSPFHTWTKEYDGPGHGDDRLVNIAENRQDNILLVDSEGLDTGQDMAVLLYSEDGAFSELLRVDSPFHGTDRAVEIVGTYERLFVAGETQVGTNEFDVVIYSIALYPSPRTAFGYRMAVPGPQRAARLEVSRTGSHLYGLYDRVDNGISQGIATRFWQRPEAWPDALGPDEEVQPRHIFPGNLLTNDYRPDGGTIEIVTAPQHGELLSASDGGFEFTAEGGYHGYDRFTYRLNNHGLLSNTVTVSFQIGRFPKSIGVGDSSLVGGFDYVFSVSLNGWANQAPVDVEVWDDSSALSVPSTVTVPKGQPEVSAPLKTFPVSSTITRRLYARRGSATISTAVTLIPGGLASLSLDRTEIDGGESTKATLRLTGPYQDGSFAIYSDSSVLTCDGMRALDESTREFDVHSSPVTTTVTRQVFVKFGAITKSARLTLRATPALAGITASPSTVTGGQALQVTVSLTMAAGSNGTTVVLSDDSSVLDTPPSLLVPAGGSSASTTVQSSKVTSTVTRRITARLGQVTRSVTVTLNP